MCDITSKQFDELKDAVELNNRTLRGSNSNIGLVATVTIIQNDVKWIREKIAENSKTSITWRWVVEKLLAPGIVGVIVGVMMILFG